MSDERDKEIAEAARKFKTSVAESGLGNRTQGADIDANQKVQPFDHGQSPVSPIPKPEAAPAPSPSPTAPPAQDPDRG